MLEEINCKTDQTEYRMSEHEERPNESTQLEKTAEKRMKKHEESLVELCKSIKRVNV
jgi:riboflavin synthase